MKKIMKLLVVSSMAASFAAPFNVNAGQNDSVSCSIVVVGSAPYQANFVVQPGVDFFEDFGTFSRIKEFSASTQTANGVTTVTVDYFADVNTFDSIDFSSTITLPNGRGIASAKGSAGYGTSVPNVGFRNGDASYAINCRRN